MIPCDCLILQGNAVVNEASLTGESVPQLKDEIDTSDDDDISRILDMTGRDRIHILFSGTSLLQATNCTCIVLRTGTQSAQGELTRMIEFSQQDVR